MNRLEKLFNEFMEEMEFSSKLSPITLEGYSNAFTLLMKIMPETDLANLSDKAMIEFFKRLQERQRIIGRGRAVKGVKISTIGTYRSKLNKFFEWLKMKGEIKKNPFDVIAYPNITYTDKKFLNREDLERILTAIEINIEWKNLLVKKRNIAIIYLLLTCGLRKNELLCLKVIDIDFDRKILTVRAETSKSKIDRRIPLNSKTLEILKDYIKERRGLDYSTPYLFVSCNKDDKLSVHGFKHLIEFLNRKTGIKFHAHQFRHTFAVNLLGNGSDIEKLKQLMGHHDIRMTCSYLRCLPTEAMREEVERLKLENMF